VVDRGRAVEGEGAVVTVPDAAGGRPRGVPADRRRVGEDEPATVQSSLRMPPPSSAALWLTADEPVRVTVPVLEMPPPLVAARLSWTEEAPSSVSVPAFQMPPPPPSG
jgi:hypothetical protein